MAMLRILQLLVKQYDAVHHLILNEMLQVNELMWKGFTYTSIFFFVEMLLLAES